MRKINAKGGAAKKPDPEERRHLIGFLIHDVSRLRMRYFDAVFKAMGLSHMHWWTLGNINVLAGDGISQGEIAKLLGVKKAMMGIMIDQLEDAGLVQRISDATDRRVKIIRMTERGFAYNNDLMQLVRNVTPRFNTDIPKGDLDITIRTLETMRSNVRQALAEQEAAKASQGRARPRDPTRRKTVADRALQGKT